MTTVLALVLADLGVRAAERGCAAEASALAILAAAARDHRPAAAEILVDPDARGAVRARAIAVASRALLAALDPPAAEALAARLTAGADSSDGSRRSLLVG